MDRNGYLIYLLQKGVAQKKQVLGYRQMATDKSLRHSEMVGVGGFEPPTPCSRSRCASRAALHPVIGLFHQSKTALYKHMVGVTGFEPATSSTPRKRASRAAPHPDPLCLYDQQTTYGELSRIRTWDLRFRRPALYPTELIAPNHSFICSSSCDDSCVNASCVCE
jgi:hypothetical protein